MDTLKNIGKGNRVLEKKSPEEVNPAYKSEVNEVIGFNIRRTPSDSEDTYVADALLEQVALHIPVDTLGSRQIYTK